MRLRSWPPLNACCLPAVPVVSRDCAVFIDALYMIYSLLPTCWVFASLPLRPEAKCNRNKPASIPSNFIGRTCKHTSVEEVPNSSRIPRAHMGLGETRVQSCLMQSADILHIFLLQSCNVVSKRFETQTSNMLLIR